MECDKLLIWLCVALVILIAFFVLKRSTFGAMDENGNVFLSDTYNKGCGTVREYPQGKVPGSYLGLTNAEKEGLLTKFILDNPNKLT